MYQDINENKEIYFLFYVNINNKYIYYISNPFSSRRVILIDCKNNNDFFETDKIKWEKEKVINNDNINKLLNILEKKINNHYYNVKRIYFIDKNMKEEKGYIKSLNNQKTLFIHVPFNKYKNMQILNIHIKINGFSKKYLENKLKEKKIKLNNDNLYILQYYLNMKFVFIFNSFNYKNDKYINFY